MSSPPTSATPATGEVGEREAHVGPHVGTDRVAGEGGRDAPLRQMAALDGLRLASTASCKPRGQRPCGGGARHEGARYAPAPMRIGGHRRLNVRGPWAERAPHDVPHVEGADDGTPVLEPDATHAMPPWARSWLVRIAPGTELHYDAAAWHDALVVLAIGRIELCA